MKGLRYDHRYDDIIHRQHPSFPQHPRMSAMDRAAQFSPFAALTGYDAAVKETARVTESRAELTESAKAELSNRLQMLLENITEQPQITVTWYVPDARKAGGAYHTVSGMVKKLDLYRRVLVLQDEQEIPIDDLFGLESALFKRMENDLA